MWLIAEVIRDAATGDEISPIPGAITGWEIRFLSNKKKQEVDYEYVSLKADGFSVETAGVQDDGNGNPELFLDPTKVASSNNEQDINTRLERMDFGRRVIAIMSIRNDAKTLTQGQLQQLLNDYDDINKFLQSGSIATARALIDAVTPDGTITTDADKTALLAEIDANLSRLGYV